MAVRLGIVGVGKIARDQHLPVIAGTPDFDLVAAASRNATVDVEGVANYPSIEALLAGPERVEAVSLCQPPQGRHEAARAAIAAGKHVFLEKPPGATLSEVEDLKAAAEAAGVTLFASWHSRYAPAVEPAAEWLKGRQLRSVRIVWKEDVRVWHPGQAWIWEAGGLGVFDPAINALSIATRILPPFFLTGGTLDFPENKQAPVAAELQFTDAEGTPIGVELDFLQSGEQSWDIHVETDDGTLKLSHGGSRMFVDGEERDVGPEAEYRGLYDRFAALIAAGESDVDLRPLAHVADAFLRCERRLVAEFHE